MKAKCECILNELINNNYLDNIYGQYITEFVSVLRSFNLNVMQCIKDIFKKVYFSNCFGGFLILGLLSGQCIQTITMMTNEIIQIFTCKQIVVCSVIVNFFQISFKIE